MLGNISVIDINEALPRALPMLLRHGKRQTAASLANARPTIEWPGLFVTEYLNPTRNVLLDPMRDANPFFHYLEAMWIIAGRNDVKFLAHVLPKMAEYSDDGETFHGAYGYRLRCWPTGLGGPADQIEEAIHILTDAPTSRQVVMSIWDPARDLGARTKDMPCNDMIMLKIRDGKLNITVNNRSNDAIWGCYGANAVQFSMLQMYMAARIGVGVGTYCQVSDSFHVYEDNPYWQRFKDEYDGGDQNGWLQRAGTGRAVYTGLPSVNLFEDGIEFFDAELAAFFTMAEKSMEEHAVITQIAHSRAVRNAVNIWNALMAYRAKDYSDAIRYAHFIDSPDWRAACHEWLLRRINK